MFHMGIVKSLFQIRKLQEVAKELEQRMKDIRDDLKQREAEAEKLRQTIRNTPPNDPAYVCTYYNGTRLQQTIRNTPPYDPAYVCTYYKGTWRAFLKTPENCSGACFSKVPVNCLVCIQDRRFIVFETNTVKLSVNETKWTGFGPEKLLGLSRNGPQAQKVTRKAPENIFSCSSKHTKILGL